MTPPRVPSVGLNGGRSNEYYCFVEGDAYNIIDISRLSGIDPHY